MAILPFAAYAGGMDFPRAVAVDNALNFIEETLQVQPQAIEVAAFQDNPAYLAAQPQAAPAEEGPPYQDYFPQEEIDYPSSYPQDFTPQEIKSEEAKFVDEIKSALRAIFGDRARLSVGSGLSQILGVTKYHISFDNSWGAGGHGESELEWPTKNTFFSLTGTLHYLKDKNGSGVFPRDTARFDFTWFTKFDDRAGVMRDSDWIENDVGFLGGGYQHEGLDIFSKSSSRLKKANILDMAYTYFFWPYEQFSIGPQLGYRFSRSEFSAYNLDQKGYGPYENTDTFRDSRNLEWITYTQEQSVPYMGFKSEYFRDKFFLNFNFGFSKWAHIQGEDIHLYPTSDESLGHNIDMMIKGRTKGSAILWGVEGGWNFWPQWLLNVGVNYMDIFTKGAMTETIKEQGFSDLTLGDVGAKVTAEYWQINTGVKYLF